MTQRCEATGGRTPCPARRPGRPWTSLVLLPAVLLALGAPARPFEDETDRFRVNLDSATDSIRVVERELGRFDGRSGPSEALREASAGLASHLAILRANADRHTLAPPGLGGIVAACAGLDRPSLHEARLQAVRQESDRETEQFRVHTDAFLQTRRALNQLVAGKSVELWLMVMPVDDAWGLLEAADSLVGVFAAQEGFPAGSYADRHRQELVRRTAARAQATGLTRESPRIGWVFAAYKELALLARENYERSEKRVKELEAERKALEEGARSFASAKADHLVLCDRIKSETGWRPGRFGPPVGPSASPTRPRATPAPAVVAVAPPAPGPVEVPHVTGWARENAEQAMSGVGLAVASATTVASSHVPAGSVIDQFPEGGTKVAPGTAVALVVSRGPSQPGQLVVEPTSVDLEIGETVEFAAKAVFDDGSVQYFTYGSTWSPGPDHKFTATRQGTYTVTASFRGLSGQAVVRVASRTFTAPVLPAPGTALPGASPEDYTWFALCRPRDGEVSYGEHPNPVTHRVLGGPFPGPRSAVSWIGQNCPSWRCTSSGTCAAGPAPATAGVDGWYVLCNPRSRAVGVARTGQGAGQQVMAGPFLGEPDARSWVLSTCPSWLCDQGGACAPGAVPAASGGWTAGPVSTPGPAADPAGWGAGAVTSLDRPPEPVMEGTSAFVEAATAEAAACRYPAALWNADQLAQVAPGHPWLTANHERLRDLAERQRRAVEEIGRGRDALERKKHYEAGKSAQRAAEIAPSCMRDLIEGFGDLARQAQQDEFDRQGRERAERSAAAAAALPGLLDALNRAVEAQGPRPPAAGAGAPQPGAAPRKADPCETKATYLNKWNTTPRCDCPGYGWNGYKCVPGRAPAGAPPPAATGAGPAAPGCARITQKFVDPPPYTGVSLICAGTTGGTWLQTAGGMHKVVSVRPGKLNPQTGCHEGSEVVTEDRTYAGRLCPP